MEFHDLFNSINGYRDKYTDEPIVIKFGGTLAEDPVVVENLAKQVEYLSDHVHANVILVHGGGVLIDRKLNAAGLQVKKDPVSGIRITDHASLEIIDRELRALNRDLVKQFTAFSPHLSVIGMAGYDGFSISADAQGDSYTGFAKTVNENYLKRLINTKGNIPLIYPICLNENGGSDPRLNVNADTVASVLASKLKARRLILCSDVSGVLDSKKELIKGLSTTHVDELIESQAVTGGMIEKLKSAACSAQQLKSGGVVILDGREENSILKELLTDEGCGTLIRRPERIADMHHPEFTNYRPNQT